jgi:hypothetical protein
MSAINTEHPDLRIDDTVCQSIKFADDAASPINGDRRNFYWRLLYYCSAQLNPNSPGYMHTPKMDPVESACVMNAITQIERSASVRFQNKADQRILFFKRLHRILSAHVYGLESITSCRVDDEPFEHCHF